MHKIPLFLVALASVTPLVCLAQTPNGFVEASNLFPGQGYDILKGEGILQDSTTLKVNYSGLAPNYHLADISDSGKTYGGYHIYSEHEDTQTTTEAAANLKAFFVDLRGNFGGHWEKHSSGMTMDFELTYYRPLENREFVHDDPPHQTLDKYFYSLLHLQRPNDHEAKNDEEARPLISSGLTSDQAKAIYAALVKKFGSHYVNRQK